MGFVGKLALAGVLSAGLSAVVPSPDGRALAADPRPGAASRAPQPSPATGQGPTAVEILNKSLNPGASSDPDVPLPHPDLANVGPAGPSRGTGGRLYGRQEEGGGVFGLRMPIPVDRGAAAASPRSGGSPGAGGNTLQNR